MTYSLTNAAVDDISHEPTIVKLTDKTFGKTVSEAAAPWLVLLYIGNSSFGRAAATNFKVAADLLKLTYKFGLLDLTANHITANSYKLITYDDAALFIFGDDRTNPIVKLQSGKSWEVSHFIKEGIQGLQQIITWRLETYKITERPTRKPVVLTPETFLDNISSQNRNGTYSPWLVLFHSDDNSESAKLKSVFETASAELYPKVNTGSMDVGQYYNFTGTFFDQLFVPTIIYIGMRSNTNLYPYPIMPMSMMPTVGHICNFALTERLLDLSTVNKNSVSAVVISFGDLPYTDTKIFHFGENITFHVFTRL